MARIKQIEEILVLFSSLSIIAPDKAKSRNCQQFVMVVIGQPGPGCKKCGLPVPIQQIQENPIMQEIRKYISPEYWTEVAALIEEFDLELISVTRKESEQ